MLFFNLAGVYRSNIQPCTDTAADIWPSCFGPFYSNLFPFLSTAQKRGSLDSVCRTINGITISREVSESNSWRTVPAKLTAGCFNTRPAVSLLTLLLVRSSCSRCSPSSSIISVPIWSVSAAIRCERSMLWLARFRLSVPWRSSTLCDCRLVWKITSA